MLSAIFNKSLKQHPTKQKLYSHFSLLSVKQGGYQVSFLKSLVWHDLGLNPWSPGSLANTLPTTKFCLVVAQGQKYGALNETQIL